MLLHSPDGEDWEVRADDVRLPAAPVRLPWAAPNRLLLVDEHARLHRSTDGGASWTPTPLPKGSRGLVAAERAGV